MFHINNDITASKVLLLSRLYASYFLSCLITMAIYAVWYGSGYSECLISDLSKKVFNILPLRIIRCRFFIPVLYQVKKFVCLFAVPGLLNLGLGAAKYMV